MISWDVSPVLLSLGPLELRWYGLVYALGFLLVALALGVLAIGVVGSLSLAPLVAVWREFAFSPEALATEGLAFLKPLCAEIWGE